MKKVVFSFLAVICAVSFAAAQSLEDGVKALYYQKYTDAGKILQDLVNKKAEGEAIYWLGQVYLENTFGESDGVGKAQALYQKYASTNDPWVLVGLGEIDYINHNKQAAEQKFDKALATKFKGRHKDEMQAALMTAIGRASIYGNRDIGDPAYAIGILQKAMDLDKTNPAPCVILGMNFLKLGGEGGNAFVAFNNAILRDPTYAEGFYRMGRIFHSQNNFDVMDEWYKKGIAADPTYAPIYLDYFDFFKNTDYNKAKGYLDLYVKNSDGGCNVQYFQADYLFRSGSYQESINKAKEMEAGTCADFSHLNLLLGMNYHRLGDSVQAVNYANKFFAKTAATNLTADDYAFGGYIFKETTATADSAVKYLKMAYALDTLEAQKAIYADSIAYALEKANKPVEKYKWLRQLYDEKDSTSDGYNTALFNAGYAAFELGKTDSSYYPTADTLFELYKTKYPDQIYGYKYLRDSKLAQKDTTAAVPAVLDYIAFMKKDDSVKYKDYILAEYGMLAGYYVNSKNDYENGLKMFDAILAFDPTNEAAKQFGDQIRTFLDAQKAEKDSTESN